MIRHEVLIKFKRNTGPAEVAEAMQKLRALASEIPVVEAVWIGASRHDLKGPSTHCLLVLEIADEAALNQYNSHPTRAEMAQLVSALAENVAVADLPG